MIQALAVLALLLVFVGSPVVMWLNRHEPGLPMWMRVLLMVSGQLGTIGVVGEFRHGKLTWPYSAFWAVGVIGGLLFCAIALTMPESESEDSRSSPTETPTHHQPADEDCDE